jgi:hypothetical protein
VVFWGWRSGVAGRRRVRQLARAALQRRGWVVLNGGPAAVLAAGRVVAPEAALRGALVERGDMGDVG